MLNKKWLAGAIFGAFILAAAGTGGQQAEASAFKAPAAIQTMSGETTALAGHHGSRSDYREPRHIEYRGPRHIDHRPPHRPHYDRYDGHDTRDSIIGGVIGGIIGGIIVNSSR